MSHNAAQPTSPPIGKTPKSHILKQAKEAEAAGKFLNAIEFYRKLINRTTDIPLAEHYREKIISLAERSNE